MHLSDRLAHLALEALHPRLHPLQLLLEVEHRLDASEVEPSWVVSFWIRRSRSRSASE